MSAKRSFIGLRWITIRKIFQAASLAGFLVLLTGIHRGVWAPEWSNLPFRIDPLAMLAQSLASRTFLAGSALAILVVLLTLITGRAWCGWLCPMGTVLDVFTPRQRMKNQRLLPNSWRKAKYLSLILVVAAALLTNLTLLIFDPITILFRTVTLSIFPAIDQAITALESALVQIPFLEQALAGIDTTLRPAVLPMAPAYFRYALLYGAIFSGILALNWIAPRFWCRYLCPLGGMLGWIAKLSLVSRRVSETCKDCRLCACACPVATIRADKSYTSDPAECTVCMECVDVCHLGGNSFTAAKPSPRWSEYGPKRREAFQVIGAGALATALAQSEPAAARPHHRLIQPPGAISNDLASKCIRCGECMRACPTSGLQPSIAEAGFAGFWTPVLIPRIGYCDYSCNACGQVCPVKAIPALSLEEKRQQVIGLAYIDQNRCIAWSDHRDCIVCEEMCPVPEKAILLQPAQVNIPGREAASVKLPYVLRDRCIGCGICEYKCPVAGEAAIRVSTPTTSLG